MQRRERLRITYASRSVVAYTRDKMGRITAVSATPPSGTGQTVLSGITYQPFGPASALTYGNGITENRSFDADYRLTHLADFHPGTWATGMTPISTTRFPRSTN